MEARRTANHAGFQPEAKARRGWWFSLFPLFKPSIAGNLAKTGKKDYGEAMDNRTLKKGKARSFLNGFMSAFAINGQAFISIPDLDSGFRKDREALQGDWQRVGDDMRRAMNIVTNEQ